MGNTSQGTQISTLTKQLSHMLKYSMCSFYQRQYHYCHPTIGMQPPPSTLNFARQNDYGKPHQNQQINPGYNNIMRWNQKTPSNYKNNTRQGESTFSKGSTQERESPQPQNKNNTQLQQLQLHFFPILPPIISPRIPPRDTRRQGAYLRLDSARERDQESPQKIHLPFLQLQLQTCATLERVSEVSEYK